MRERGTASPGCCVFSCTKPEWILLGFEAGVLSGALALAAPSEFNIPLEIIRLHGEFNERTDSLRLLKLAIELAGTLGARELYYTISEDSPDAAVISEAQFYPSRKVVRFESTGPADLGCGVIDPPKSVILNGPK